MERVGMQLDPCIADWLRWEIVERSGS